jgi:20S proteasome subunit beta 6
MEQRLDYVVANDMARTDETRAHLSAELARTQERYDTACRDYEARIKQLNIRHTATAFCQGTQTHIRQSRYRGMAPFSLSLALPLSFMFLSEVGSRNMYLSYGLWSVTLLLLVQAATASFEPYQLNGGLVSAVAGKNFAIIGADTRMIGEGGYLLESRNHLSNRLWSVTDDKLMFGIESSLRSDADALRSTKPVAFSVRGPSTMVGASGCSTDCSQLQRVIRADIRAATYFGQVSSFDPDQVANVVSQTLYWRRGFPYYSFCVVSGLDSKEGGCGKVYVYDAIGSYEQVAVAAAGTGRELLQPILDRLFQSHDNGKQVDGSADDAIECLCKAYRSVSEREIGVGDNLVLHVSETHNDGSVSCRVLVVKLKDH